MVVPVVEEASAPRGDDLAIVLFGGGARAAYQVGLLRCLAKHRPELRLPIITGVSAGAINAAFLAAHPGPLSDAVEGLTRLWSELEVDRVFRVDSASLLSNLLRWSLRLVSGGGSLTPQVQGLVDTAPLRTLLETHLSPSNGEIPGIAKNLEAGRLRALAVVTSSYSTGQSVAWIQGCDLEAWERPHRQSHLPADPRPRPTFDSLLRGLQQPDPPSALSQQRLSKLSIPPTAGHPYCLHNLHTKPGQLGTADPKSLPGRPTPVSRENAESCV